MSPVPVLLVCMSHDKSWSVGYILTLNSGFIGFPSVGKSTLMSRLTGQHSEGSLQASLSQWYGANGALYSCCL